jgi:hypothetical protein
MQFVSSDGKYRLINDGPGFTIQKRKKSKKGDTWHYQASFLHIEQAALRMIDFVAQGDSVDLRYLADVILEAQAGLLIAIAGGTRRADGTSEGVDVTSGTKPRPAPPERDSSGGVELDSPQRQVRVAVADSPANRAGWYDSATRSPSGACATGATTRIVATIGPWCVG